MANVPTRQFFGTAQTVINTATDIASGNFSGAPAATFDNTTDADVPYATHAQAMIEIPDWAAAPVTGSSFELWGMLKEVDGADNDTDTPSGSSSGGARYFGAWWMVAVDALQRRTMVISLAGVKKVDFYVRNGTTQNANNDTGTNLVVKITPFSYGAAV